MEHDTIASSPRTVVPVAPGGVPVNNHASASPTRPAALRRLTSRVADALFGYDVFVSYAWDDGGSYPTALVARLRSEGYRVFLDREGYVVGDHLPQATRRRVGMSRMLLIVFRPKVVDSQWVLREVEICLATGGIPVVLDVNNSFEHAPKVLETWRLLSDSLRINETVSEPAEAPTDYAIGEIRRHFTFRRVESRQLRVVAGVATVLALACVAAIGFFLRARTAAELELDERRNAERLLLVAKSELANGLHKLGTIEQKRDPASAVRLALASYDVKPSRDAVELLERSLLDGPVWNRIGPPSAARAQPAMVLPSIGPTDVYAVDPDLDSVVVGAQTRSDVAEVLGQRLLVRRVPDGQVIGTLQLKQDEVFITPEGTSRLFAVRGLNRVEIREATAAGLSGPATIVDGGMDVAFTNGDWPAYVLTATGDVLSLSATDHDHRTPPRSVGRFPGARSILAHPQGGSLVACGADGLTWVPLGGGTPSVLVWPGLPGVGGRPRERQCLVRWGPNATDFVVAEFARTTASNADTLIRVYAVDGSQALRQELRQFHFDGVGLNRWFLEGDARGVRFAAESGDRHGSGLDVFDLEWHPSPGVVARVKPHAAGAIAARSPDTRRRFAVAAAFSPHGRSLVVASYLKGAGDFDGLGWLERCDLSSIYSESPQVPCHRLQSEPAVQLESDEPEAGNPPFVRVAFSRDGARVAAWDYRGVYHIFRIEADDHDNLSWDPAPRIWRGRLQRPHLVFGPFGSSVVVRYGDGETNLLDLEAGVTTSLSNLLEGEGLLGVVRLPGTQRIALVTATRVMLERDGTVLERRLLPGSVDRVFEGNGVVVAAGPGHVFLLRSTDMALVGQIVSDDTGRILEARLAETDPSEEDEHDGARSDFAEVEPGRWRILTRHEGQLESWTVKASSGGLFVVQDTFRLRLKNPDQTWYTYRRINKPDTLLFKAGANTAEGLVSPIEQFDLESGKAVTRFAAPTQGWPRRVLEIETAHAESDQVSILVRYVPPGSYEDRIAVGVWPRSGGACLRWVDLGPRKGAPLYLGEDGTVAMFWAASDLTRVSLLDLRTGREIWAGQVAGRGVPPPFLLVGAQGQREPAHPEWYEAAAHELLIRGRRYWDAATLVALPPEQAERIKQLK